MSNAATMCMREAFREGVILDGRYETLSYVHEGSFGMVFRARDLVTGNIVAIKCLTKRSVVDESNAEFAAENLLRDSQECAIHMHLGSHPNIVSLLHSFETESHLYFVLEYCARGDLYEAIRAGKGPVTTEDVRQLMLQVLAAVEYIHYRGVYHRDIKPENIFLTSAGQVKLGDFGLATTEAWSHENAIGSDRYMSPEQFDSSLGGYSPAQADLWAVGICLLNMLFSKNPFNKPTADDVFFRDFVSDRCSLFDIFPTMSEDTFRVLEHCLAMTPEKRSIPKIREALCRVESFTTTCDDDIDDFLVGSPKAQATANREPLATPALSPALTCKAWCPSGPFQNPTAKPVTADNIFGGPLGSAWSTEARFFATSVALTAAERAAKFDLAFPEKRRNRSGDNALPATPLGIDVARPQTVDPMSAIRRSEEPKSWSDMYDEDCEAEILMKATSLELNSGTTPTTTDSSIADRIGETSRALQTTDVKPNTTDGALAGVLSSPCNESTTPVLPRKSRYNPPPRRGTPMSADKWSALGARRRAFADLNEKRLAFRSAKSQAFMPSSSSVMNGSIRPISPLPARARRGLGNPRSLAQHDECEPACHFSQNSTTVPTSKRPRLGQTRDLNGCPWTRRQENEMRSDFWRKDSHKEWNKWVGSIVEARS